MGQSVSLFGKPALIIFHVSAWKSETDEGTQNLTRVQWISRGYTESDECSTFLTFPEFAISAVTLCESKRNPTRGKSSLTLVIFPVKMHLTAGSQGQFTCKPRQFPKGAHCIKVSQEFHEGQVIFYPLELPKGAHYIKVSGIPRGECHF